MGPNCAAVPLAGDDEDCSIEVAVLLEDLLELLLAAVPADDDEHLLTSLLLVVVANHPEWGHFQQGERGVVRNGAMRLLAGAPCGQLVTPVVVGQSCGLPSERIGGHSLLVSSNGMGDSLRCLNCS